MSASSRLGAGWISENEKPDSLRRRSANLEEENRLPNCKPNDEDKDEKKLETEEDESEEDEPLSIVDKESSPKSKKGQRGSTSTR